MTETMTHQQLTDKVNQFTNFTVKTTTAYNADYLEVPFTTILYGERVLFTISDTVANSIQINSLDSKHTYGGIFTDVLHYAIQYALTPILDRQLDIQMTIHKPGLSSTVMNDALKPNSTQKTVSQPEKKDSNE